MPKMGILHDYDLEANEEEIAQNKKCKICGEHPMRFQWSDYSGEAMCTKCGCPYQLKWGTTEQQTEGHYPYINMKKDFIPIAEQYWLETGNFTCYGLMMGPRPGMVDLIDWLEKKYPKYMKLI